MSYKKKLSCWEDGEKTAYMLGEFSTAVFWAKDRFMHTHKKKIFCLISTKISWLNQVFWPAELPFITNIAC